MRARANINAMLQRVLYDDSACHSLDLEWAQLGDGGAAQLARRLDANTHLHTLRLWSNRIGDEGAAELAGALATNTSLTLLNLSHNAIGDEGAAELAAALGSNTTLATLDLRANKITAAGGALLDKLRETGGAWGSALEHLSWRGGEEDGWWLGQNRMLQCALARHSTAVDDTELHLQQ